jgi:uncharacterized protein (UPF0333 family)
MILYDDKYNFLGMSSHTLGFLGYEDIGEFLSLNNDFANLFVNKEGYIYNFDNFNWIDFVLYSGAANKSAIITLKNGKETKVDLSIKEVHLAHDLNGIKKFYSVKVISDKFQEISGIPKSSDTVGGIGGFSLSGLVANESVKEEKVEIKAEENNLQSLISNTPKEKETSNSFILNTPETEENKSESFILNTTEDELTQETERVVPDVQNDVQLDFLSKEVVEKEEESSDFTLLQVDNEPEKVEKEPTMDFLLKSDDLDSSVIKEDVSGEREKEAPETFEFNLLKDTQPSAELESNLIKEEVSAEDKVEEDFNITPKQELKDELPFPTKDNEFKLDFLKTDLEPKVEVTPPVVESDEISYKKTDNTKIIQQIQNDIKEIDSTDQEIEPKENEDEPFILDIPSMPQVEQPLVMEQNTKEQEPKKEEPNNLEALSSFQIQESKSQETNKSFTNTLKELFGNSKDVQEEPSSTESNDNSFQFKLLKDEDIEETQVKEDIQPQAIHVEKEPEQSEDKKFSFKDDTKKDEIQPVEENIEEIKFASLSALGLSPDDEFDLLSDFITDAKDSIETIEQFVQTKDFDKINYSLVKIKSSAEILNLNAIIGNTNSIRKHCVAENSETVILETKKLKENIELLEKQLTATAI